jgi:hypothetical protein
MTTPPHGFVNDDDQVQHLHAPLGIIATMALWHGRMASTIRELQADLNAARGLIGALQTANGLHLVESPPPQLVHAWRSKGTHDQPVAVEMDGMQVTLIVDGDQRPDPVRESRDWLASITTFRTIRGQVR